MFTLATQTLIPSLAQTTAPAGGGGFGDLFHSPLLPVVVIFGIFMLFMSNSKRKQERQQKDMLSNMKRNDRVQTIGGILGTIVEVRDNEIVVKVDEGNNTKMKFVRSAIHRVIREEDKAEAVK